jgi:L,D-peptidoglycan transpeptidase YkuD (ErfK/YbiS/YcfS/YnhG family)
MNRSSLFLSVTMAAVALAIAAPADSNGPASLAKSSQLIVVTTPDWNAVDGRLQRYERATPKARWRPVGPPFSIVVGKTGLAWGLGIVSTDQVNLRAASDPVKKEGDGKAPAGVFALGSAFGDAPQPLATSKMPYQPLTPSIECVDDMRSKYYNRLVDRTTVVPDWNSSEHMRSVGEAYRWGVVVEHNAGDKDRPPVPGGGSCIFLHIWSGAGHGTVGCTAMPQQEVESLLGWLDPARRPLLVQLPAAQYRRMKDRWKLPELGDAGSR